MKNNQEVSLDEKHNGLVAIFFLFSCHRNPPETEYVRYADKLTKDCFSEINQKYMTRYQSNAYDYVGYMINAFCVDLRYDRAVTVDEARRLLFAIADEYLAVLNSDPTIRPYLVKHPLGYENLEIAIDFPEDRQNDRHLEHAFLGYNVIKYYRWDLISERMRTLHIERVESAARKINEYEVAKINSKE